MRVLLFVLPSVCSNMRATPSKAAKQGDARLLKCGRDFDQEKPVLNVILRVRGIAVFSLNALQLRHFCAITSPRIAIVRQSSTAKQQDAFSVREL